MQPSQEEEQAREIERQQQKQQAELILSGADDGSSGPKTVVRSGDKVGRNAPCPCGSGKKYKKCHGAAA
jgi:preprotein translocase subunit SecA